MAWNGSDQKNKSPGKFMVAKSEGSPKTRKMNRVIVIIAFVILCGVVFFLLTLGKDDGPTSEVKPATSLIKEVAPSLSTNSSAGAVASTMEVPEDKNANVPTYIDEKGVERYRGGARVYKRGGPVRRIPRERPAFRHYSENQIWALVHTAPGAPLFGTRHYDQRFKDDFAAAVVDKIEIEESDSDVIKDRKKAMIELKKQLVDRIRAGEDICEIMEQTYKEHQRLGAEKRFYQQELAKMAKSGDMTSKDCEELVDAVNKKLTEKGISPISASPIIRMNMKFGLRATKGEQE